MRSAAMRMLAVLGILLSPAALADDAQVVKLKEAPGRELVAANCSLCHSLDYIPMNSVFLDRKGWEGSVTKMIKVMGAPVKPEDVQKIVDYLAESYGKK
jgi:mono/diheme cytochrome c family protein